MKSLYSREIKNEADYISALIEADYFCFKVPHPLPPEAEQMLNELLDLLEEYEAKNWSI